MSGIGIAGSTPDTTAQWQRNLFARLGQAGFADAVKTGAGDAAGGAGPAASAGGAASRIEAAFKALDTDGDGRISSSEFNAGLARRAAAHRPERTGHHPPERTGQPDVGSQLAAQLFGQGSPTDARQAARAYAGG